MAKKQKAPALFHTGELQQEMYTVGQALKQAYERFNWADDPDIIDACVFEINACMARYNYLLRCLKAQSNKPSHQMHAYSVPAQEAQSVPCVAAANVKGGDICRS